MSRKVQLRLLASKEMSEKGENNLIRFPRRARNYLGFANNIVVLEKGEYQTTFRVKKAYKEDVHHLAKMIQQGRLSDEEATSVGFVTKSVQQRVNRKEGNAAWVSDGIGNITIGADPEFGLIGEDGLLHRGSHVIAHAGVFGSDGPSVEVRPPPDRNHLVVVKRIESILKNPPAAADKFKWQGGATYRDPNRVYWFGGHIHLGRPAQIQEDVAYTIYQRIATTLDSLLALPMCRFDGPEPFRRRNGCQYHYGKAGDIRADYPEQNRFEYRVLSGLWLVHPTLAKIALGAAKCITETAYGRIADQKFDFDWANFPLSKNGLLKSFGLKDIRGVGAIINRAQPNEVTTEHVGAWKRQLLDLDLFDDYAAELKALMALATAPPSEINLDIRANWYDPQTPLFPKAGTRLQRALEAVEEKS
jgi:hypothetical protein